MKIIRIAFFSAVVLIGAAVPGYVFAADFELTPFAGYTWGGQFIDSVTNTTLEVKEANNYGVMLDIKQDEQSQIELYFSRQASQLKANNTLFTGNPLFDLDVEYYHVGGTYAPAADPGKVRGFLVGTLGATHMVPQGAGLNSLTKFSLSLGGGVKFYATEHIGLRLEGRWFGTLFDGSGQAFCTSGQCLIKVQGDLFSQFVANAGVLFAF